MDIAIIGAGWLGCHLASKLKINHDITLFDKTGIFSESSYYNQNRLHKGFHYSRNQKTRKLCYDTFDTFIQDYPFLVEDIDKNYYAVPVDKSLLDYATFKAIFLHENIGFQETTVDMFKNIDGCMIVDEKYINPENARKHFIDSLSDILTIENITEERIHQLSKEYDLVINVSNNRLLPLENHYFELSLTLVYETLLSDFGSLTMVDGPLFSIYPFKGNLYTVTDVEYTPLFVADDPIDLDSYRKTIDLESIEPIRKVIEAKIQKYYPEFRNFFTYDSFYTSVKVKRYSESADRSPVIIKQDNIISAVTGKIQGIYAIENYLQNEVINR
jgi:hypothetical protein